jgi:ATP-binding cassette subfamily B protein
MYRIGLAPRFGRERERLLALQELPDLEMPAEVEAAAGAFVREAGVPEDGVPVRAGRLWLDVARSTRKLMLRTTLLAFGAAGAASLATVVGTRILDAPGGGIGRGLALATVFFAMNLVSRAFLFGNDRIRAWVGLGGETYLAARVARKLVRLSPLAAERQSAGNLKVLITSDVKNVGSFLDNAVRNFLPSVVAAIVIAPLLAYYGGVAGFVGIGILLTIVPVAMLLNRISIVYQDRALGELDRLTSAIGEWVSNIRLIRYLSWEASVEADVSSRLRAYVRPRVAQHFMACVIFGLSSSWWMVAAGGVLYASSVSGYGIDARGFFGSLWLLTYLAHFLTHVPNTVRLYGIAAPSMERIAKFLSEEERSSLLEKEAGPPVASRFRRVRLEGVTFTYPGATKPSLDRLDFEIELGEKAAILGEVGSGKSTLLKLLSGEYPPTSGRVLLETEGGEVVSLWSSRAYEAWRSSIAAVPQEPFVAHDLFSRNVSLSDAATPEEEARIVESAYLAELEADIAALPKGIYEEIGEGGVNLSGGQRQRVNLARAFHSGRGYLLLDDTLSAVDGRTEARLMDRLGACPGGFLLVTHRVRELGSVARVLVMRDGRVVEQGVPSTLARDPSSAYSRVLRAYEQGEGAHV